MVKKRTKRNTSRQTITTNKISFFTRTIFNQKTTLEIQNKTTLNIQKPKVTKNFNNFQNFHEKTAKIFASRHSFGVTTESDLRARKREPKGERERGEKKKREEKKKKKKIKKKGGLF
jgi:hypothetical protein